MPRCVVCDSKYFHTSWSSPAEPCDCGACWDAGPDRDIDWSVANAARDRWARGEAITDDKGNWIEPVEVEDE